MLMGAGHLQKPFWSVRWANGNDKGGRGRKRRGVWDLVRAVWHYKNRLLICMTICQVGRTERMPSSSSTGAKLLGSKLPLPSPPLCLLLPCTAANRATDQATVRQYALRHFVSFAAKGSAGDEVERGSSTRMNVNLIASKLDCCKFWLV